VLAILGFFGCSDPELHITIDVPEAYDSMIVASNLRVLEPPLAEPFGCEQIAYGEVDSDLVRLSRVLEVTLRQGQPVPIGDVDRTAPKVILAEGLDQGGQRILVACGELGSIEETQDVILTAEPLAVVTASAAPDLLFQPGASPRPVMIAVHDRLGAPIANAEARWKITGAAALGSEGTARADGSGLIAITASPPPRPGPLVLTVRVRWAETEPLRLSGAVAPSKQILTLGGGLALRYVAGRIGAEGQPGIAALTMMGMGGATRVSLAHRSGPGGDFIFRTTDPLPTTARMGILDRGGQGRDRIIVVTDSQWIEVGPEGTLSVRPYQPIRNNALPISIFPVEACTPGSPPLVLVNFELGDRAQTIATGVYDDQGRQVTHFLNGIAIEAVGSGCVSTQNPEPIRTLLLSTGAFGLLVVAQVSPVDFLVGTWIALDFGVGFSPPIDSAGRLLIGTQLNLSDIVITRTRLTLGEQDSDNELTIENLGLDTVPFTPQMTHGGDIDADGKVDVVTLLYQPGVQSQNEPDRFHVWSILGIDDGGHRIAGAVLRDITNLGIPVLLFYDIDGDGTGDIILGERREGVTENTVEIYPMRRN
jgi:hypothetical protein